MALKNLQPAWGLRTRGEPNHDLSRNMSIMGSYLEVSQKVSPELVVATNTKFLDTVNGVSLILCI